MPPAYPLDLPEGVVEVVAVEVVERVDRDHEVEALVGEGQLCGTCLAQKRLHLPLGVVERVARDVDPRHLHARHCLREVVE